MKISKSQWVLHYDGSSCNGCDIEVLAAMTPLYDVERFGIVNTGNPKHADILLPKSRHYWVETSWSQYAHAHHEQDLQMTRQIIAELHPDELSAFDQVMRRRTAHRFNMFVMKREPLNAYCVWLFPILFTLESRLDISGYTPNDMRVFGFVAERLLDVWLESTHAVYRELPVAFMEKQNWFKKGTAFLIRKIRRRSGR